MHNHNVRFSTKENVFRSVSSLVLLKMSVKVIHLTRKRAINDLGPVDSIPPKRKRITNDKILIPMSINERHFYHSQSMEPFSITNEELSDSASDSESVDGHLHQRKLNSNRILNDGERAIMNLWNEFLQKQRIRVPRGLSNVRGICHSFIDYHGREIVNDRLYRNFILHLCNMKDIMLLSSADMMHLVRHIQQYYGIKFECNEKAAISDLDKRKLKVVKKKVSTSKLNTNRPKRVHYSLRSASG